MNSNAQNLTKSEERQDEEPYSPPLPKLRPSYHKEKQNLHFAFMIVAMITFRKIFLSTAFYGKVYGKTGHSETMIFNLLKVTDLL